MDSAYIYLCHQHTGECGEIDPVWGSTLNQVISHVALSLSIFPLKCLLLCEYFVLVLYYRNHTWWFPCVSNTLSGRFFGRSDDKYVSFVPPRLVCEESQRGCEGVVLTLFCVNLTGVSEFKHSSACERKRELLCSFYHGGKSDPGM